MKRFHYAFKRLHQVLTARITAEPIYELKTAFAHHAYLCAEHVAALRTRIGEMREPPLGLEDVPHPALEAFFDEMLAAPTTEELLEGTYLVAVVMLDQAIREVHGRDQPVDRRAVAPGAAVRAARTRRDGAVGDECVRLSRRPQI